MEQLKCLMCAGELIMFEVKVAKGEITGDPILPSVNDAYTLAPSWQQQQVMGQMVMACVALPTCKKHLTVSELSPADQALRNGKLLQGRLG